MKTQKDITPEVNFREPCLEDSFQRRATGQEIAVIAGIAVIGSKGGLAAN